MLCVVVGTVLRFWALGAGTLTADETFSALAAHLPYGQIWGDIARTDRHPPLSYYLLGPISHATTSTFALRVPAALAAVAALVVFVWWQRRYGLGGLVASAIFAVSPFVLEYDRQARMFALLTLGGVVAAAASDRWLHAPERRWALAAAGGGLIAAMSYSVGVLLPVLLVLVPGRRRDRAAWIFRLAAAGAAGVWVVTWLANSLRWLGEPSGYPKLTPNWAAGILDATVAPVPDYQWIVLAMLAAGLVVALREPGPRRQLTLALYVVPVVVMLVLSFHNELFIPKTLLMIAWAPPVLLGGLVAKAWALRPIAGGAVIALLIVLIVPYVSASLPIDEGAGSMLAAVARARRPGDAVAMNPPALADLIEWYDGVVPGHALELDTSTIKGALVVRDRGVTPTGRIWLVQSILRSDELTIGPDLHSCGPTVDVGGGYTMRCVERGAGG